MWVVYLQDCAGVSWGYKYFNQEDNARRHLEMLEKIQTYSLPCMDRIFTED